MSKLMPIFVFGILFLFFTNATADTRVFPPVGCSKNEIRVMGWQEDSEDTKCLSGKELFETAFKSMGCAEGQTVGYVGGQAVCQASGGFGGTYTTYTTQKCYSDWCDPVTNCAAANSKTKSCSCPTGTSAFEISRSYQCTTNVNSYGDPDRVFAGVSGSSSCTPYYVYECH